MDLTRREFIKNMIAVGACTGLAVGSEQTKSLLAATTPKVSNKILRGREKSIKFEKEAMFYEKLKDNEIKCKLCPKECVIGDRERGWCGVRENREGTYYTLVYGNPCTITPDPIEKKPLNHFLPGSWAYSLATAGCNLNCKFCQNWEISQSRPEETKNWSLLPSEAVSEAKQADCKSIAFTYSEPTVFYEYMLDISKLARKEGIRSVVISAGFINPEPLKLLCKNVDTIKIDLKSFSNDFYNKICSAELQPVLNTLKIIKASGVWLEIVYLVIPTLNDSDAEILNTAKWIFSNLGPDVPLHFSRFSKKYQLDLPTTSVERLNSARQMAMDIGLHYVYVGNVSGNPGESTYCPKCKKEVIKRQLYIIRQMNVVNGKCKWCGEKIPGVWA
jgi:pyruvate formate lyase activating enzyme